MTFNDKRSGLLYAPLCDTCYTLILIIYLLTFSKNELFFFESPRLLPENEKEIETRLFN